MVALSVNLMPDAPAAQLAELAVRAEQLGYVRCWVYDEGLVTRDVYVTLAAIAMRTERIPLGPGITNPYVRHPGATGAAIASLDELSGGRAFVGIGAGGGLTLGPLGIERRRPAATVEAMVRALRQLFAGQRVDHRGEVFSFDQATIGYARPGIEVFLAGRGPRMMALGARLADGFNLSYIHKDLLGDHARRLREGALRERGLREGAAGRRFLITYSTMIATTDAEYEQARAQLSFRLVDSPPEVKERLAMSEAQVTDIRRALAEGGPRAAARFVDPAWVPAFVICGTPEACRAELTALMADNDLDEFQLATLEAEGAGELIERTAALFAR